MDTITNVPNHNKTKGIQVTDISNIQFYNSVVL